MADQQIPMQMEFCQLASQINMRLDNGPGPAHEYEMNDQQCVTNTYDDITSGTNTDGFFASISDKREVVSHSLEL